MWICVVVCALHLYVFPLVSKEDSGWKMAYVKVKADERRRPKHKELKRMWRKKDMWKKEQKTLDLHKWLLWTSPRICRHAQYILIKVHTHACTHKLKQRLRELNVNDEGHIQGLATADSSSVVLRDKRRIQAGWVQNVRQTVSLSAGRAFKIEIFE